MSRAGQHSPRCPPTPRPLSCRVLSRAEYTLLLLTFTSIMWLGLMAGIIVGIALVTFVFAYEYAKVMG